MGIWLVDGLVNNPANPEGDGPGALLAIQAENESVDDGHHARYFASTGRERMPANQETKPGNEASEE